MPTPDIYKECRECNAILTKDNWVTSFRESDNRSCKDCWNKHHNSKTNKRHNPLSMYVNGRYISRKHPLYKPGNYKTFNDAAFEGTYKLDNIKEGYVYAITNKAWPDWVKIGMAIDAEDRLNSYQTSSPMRDFVLEHCVASNERRKAEKEAHTRVLPLSLDSKGEWFRIPLQQAITILDNLNEYGHTRATKKADPIQKEDDIQGSLF